MSSDFVLVLFRGVVFVDQAYCFCSIGERLTQGFWVEGVSGPAFLFRSRLPPSSSPFLLLGPVRVFFPCLRVLLLAGQRPHDSARTRTVRRLPACAFFVCSALSARAGLPLPLPRPFSFLFLSLSSLLACVSETGKRRQTISIWGIHVLYLS